MSEPNIGAAILGLYAGIKICTKGGYDWRRVVELVEGIAKEHACTEQSTGSDGSA